MVLEQFNVRAKPGQEAQFEQAMGRGLRMILARAPGLQAWSMRRCVEEPRLYQVQLEWDCIESHLVGYRQGPLAPEFRALVTPFYEGWPEQVPDMKHYEELAQGTSAGRAGQA